MTDFYSTGRERFPSPSLRVAASSGVDDAARTVILAYRAGSPETVLDRALKAARQEDGALRAVLFDSDGTAVPAATTASATEKLVSELAGSGIEYEVQRADNDVASQVLDLAADHEAEMIVMSTRKRSPMLKLLIGSSAQRVILEATCPVLVVK